MDTAGKKTTYTCHYNQLTNSILIKHSHRKLQNQKLKYTT